jgi:hypothetical protein
MKFIEYFTPRLNGWLKLSLETYISLLFSQEEKKLCKIKIPKGLPLQISANDSKNNEEIPLVPGNFIEVLIKQNLILESNNKKGHIQIVNINDNEKESNSYDVWTRGKIISYDKNLKLLFIEINDQIIIIDNMELVRALKEIKPTENTLLAYNLKQISNTEYNSIKEEMDKVLSADSDNNNKLFYIKYDVINSSLLCFGNKDDLNNLSLLKQHEKKNRKLNGEEQNTNSDFSNPNSNNNLIGIKSPRGNSDNSENIINALDDDAKKNEINESKFKKCFSYRDKFRKDIEKTLPELFQKTNYYVGKNNDNNFDIVVYGNNEEDFMEEKNNFEKKYKQVKIESDTILNKTEVNELANKTKIKYVNIEKKNLYLVGEEKHINNFKTLWGINKKYTKEIQKSSKESETIQKELQTFKKKYKIK